MEEERKVITIGDIFQQCGCYNMGLIYVFVGDDDINEFVADDGKLGDLQPHVIIPLTCMNPKKRKMIFTEEFWNHKVEGFYPVKRDVLAVFIELED